MEVLNRYIRNFIRNFIKELNKGVNMCNCAICQIVGKFTELLYAEKTHAGQLVILDAMKHWLKAHSKYNKCAKLYYELITSFIIGEM